MQVNFFFIDLGLRLLFIDLHFFIATIQIGVIVQVCYTPQARWLSDLFNRVPNIYLNFPIPLSGYSQATIVQRVLLIGPQSTLFLIWTSEMWPPLSLFRPL